MKIIRFRQRKRWVRFKHWFSQKFDPAEREISTEQDKAFRIAKKLIIDSNSILYADLILDRRIIVNGSRFVRIAGGKIRIIDGPYKYDVSFDSGRLDNLKKLFAKNLEHRHDRIEAEISDRVERSLDHILTDIEKNQNHDNQLREEPDKK